jgi:DNA-binding transcriptional regulator YhcF (GntR family)
VRIRIERSSPTPPYEQIVRQVRRAVEDGTFPPGTRLPTVRALAKQTGLVPNTVGKAYRRLEAIGFLEGRGRAGTFVPDEPPVTVDANPTLGEAARAYLERARRLGVDPPAAVEAVRRAASKR